MKKFEEEIFGKVETMITQPGCSMTRKVWYKADDIHELSNGWVSPEDHQTEVEKRKQQYEDHQEIYSKTAKKLNEAELELSKLKSQLEKQQPEIPEFVAEWIKSQDHNTRNRNGTLVYEHYKKEPENDDYYPVHDWIAYHFDEFLQALIYGYTVKEKRFYLKHKSVLIFDPDSEDSDVDELYLGAGGNFVPYQHLAKIFTQSEIDSMETGSYELVPVEDGE